MISYLELIIIAIFVGIIIYVIRVLYVIWFKKYKTPYNKERRYTGGTLPQIHDKDTMPQKCLDELTMMDMQKDKPKIKFYIDLENSAIDDVNFETETTDILTARCTNGYIGWRQYYNIIRTFDKKDANVIIRLTDNSKLEGQLGATEYYSDGTPIKFSITSNFGTKHPEIDINYDNWSTGCPRSGLTKDDYRRYVIEHEFGHALGREHELCMGVSKPSEFTEEFIGVYETDKDGNLVAIKSQVASSGVEKIPQTCSVMYQATRGLPVDGQPVNYLVTSD